MPVNSYNPVVTDVYPNIKTKEELISFIENVVQGVDNEKNDRIKLEHMVVSNSDGLNGKRIAEFILNQFNNKSQK